jgi:FkbM family methyltransferase
MKRILRPMLSRRVRNHRIWMGPLRGRRIVTSWHDYPAAILGTTERPLLEWFASEVRAGETWLDVGAHYGYTAVALGEMVGASGSVFAFEPSPDVLSHLTATIRRNQLPQAHVVPIALGEHPLEAHALRVSKGMAGQEGTGQVTILSTSLDTLWPILGNNAPIHGVKIDVQGMELSVLRGMREMAIRWHPTVVVELHRGVNRAEFSTLMSDMMLEKAEDIDVPGLTDDHSYVFRPAEQRA